MDIRKKVSRIENDDVVREGKYANLVAKPTKSTPEMITRCESL
jgi:hypothetical protein